MDGVTGFISGISDSIPSLAEISNTIGDSISVAVSNTLGRALYTIISGVNWFLGVIYEFFEVFAGQIKVSYNGEYDYLINIFFGHDTISGIYWSMALIGIVLCLAFTIIAVVRKMFDLSGKMQTTMGGILGSAGKSILIILSLNIVMVAVLNFSNVLLDRILYAFNAGEAATQEEHIEFTDEQFATMGRVLNTIGNYSINPSYSSRYNLNSCFNEIRADMLRLQEQGVFDFYYQTLDSEGNTVETWQSALQRIVYSATLSEELKMDVYYEGVSKSLLEIMEILRVNNAFYPLESYERTPMPAGNIPLDRLLFLVCTYNAALNDDLNENPSLTDPLRGPYFSGEKSIYDFAQVAADFNLFWGFNYIIFILLAVSILKELFYIVLDCIARIYNMVLLYLVAPPIIAITPMDGGGKMKQWTTAFVVQSFGVFGTIVAMRLMLVFMPVVISTDLIIFQNPLMDIIAKVLLIKGGYMVAKKASGMITGILADSAGWQSINASSLREDYKREQQERAARGGGQGGGKPGGGGGGSRSGGGQSAENLPNNEGAAAGASDAAGSGAASTGDSAGAGAAGEDLPTKEPPPVPTGTGDDTAPADDGLALLGAAGDLYAGMDMASDKSSGGGGGIPKPPDISGTEHYDEGRAWLPEGDILTADSFVDKSSSIPQAPDLSGTEHYDEGRAWLPEGDILTAETFVDKSPKIPQAPDISKTEHYDEGRAWLPEGDIFTSAPPTKKAPPSRKRDGDMG